jgi:putative ABC transport system substrate-binding protein
MKKLNVLLTIVIVFTSLSSFAQDKKMIRIGVTQIVSHPALDADQKGFENALSGSGFREGINVAYDRQNAQGDMNKANAIAKKFIDEKVDLIHAIATPTTQAIVKITRDIPVFLKVCPKGPSPRMDWIISWSATRRGKRP